MTFVPDMNDNLSETIDKIASDREAGLARLRDLAEQDDPSAIHYLGLYLAENESSEEEALPWLRKAEAFGSADAAWNLAMIANQQGDEAETKRLIDRAAELGEEDAIEARSNGYDLQAVLAKYGD